MKDTAVIGPHETVTLPLSRVTMVLTKSLDTLFMETVRSLSLESEAVTRAELCTIATQILEGGQQKAEHHPPAGPATCLLLEGEVRIMTGLLQALVREKTQPARNALYELLILLMGNGWRRGNSVSAGRCGRIHNLQICDPAVQQTGETS